MERSRLWRASVRRRQPPFQRSTPTPKHPGSDTYHKHYGDQIQLVQHHHRLPAGRWTHREVDAVGAACLCLHRDLLKVIPALVPGSGRRGRHLFSRRFAQQHKLLVDGHTPSTSCQYTASYEDFVKLRDAGATMSTVVADVVTDLKDRLIVTTASSEPSDTALGRWVLASPSTRLARYSRRRNRLSRPRLAQAEPDR